MCLSSPHFADILDGASLLEFHKYSLKLVFIEENLHIHLVEYTPSIVQLIAISFSPFCPCFSRSLTAPPPWLLSSLLHSVLLPSFLLRFGARSLPIGLKADRGYNHIEV